MLTKVSEFIKGPAVRHYARVMAIAVFGILVLVTVVYILPQNLIDRARELTNSENTGTTSSDFARSAPTRIVIPKINLDTTFVPPLGLNSDKTVSVPDSYEKVGWYKHGATPGEIGPAVILGHVDSYEGPAIFYNLGKLESGDEIEIARADGTTAVFVVTDIERVSQKEFPTLKVYGPIDFAGLRLVTCTGVYDHGSLKYSHNLIVYGVLKK